MNLFTKYRLTDLLENEFMDATVMGGGGSRMRERILREFKINIYTAIFKMNNQQRPTVQHRELCSMLMAAWLRGEFEGEWTHVYAWLKSLCCAPETVTTLLISYTSI